MDIRPPKRRPAAVPPVAAQPAPVSSSLPTPDATAPAFPDLSLVDSAVLLSKPKRIKKVWWMIGGAVLLLLSCVAVIAGLYQYQLRPVDPQSTTRVRVTIASGSSPAQIADTLLEKKLIQSTRAFDIYTRLTKTRSQLKAGSYSFSPSQSLASIVDHLVSGKADQFKVTFFTGGTLKAASGAPDGKKTDVETMLLRAGFSQTDIDAAFAKTYSSPLFADKPAGTSLEGYVYGDTYVIDSSTSVEQLLALSFTALNTAVVDNDIVAGFKAQGLSLYEGLTLASIVQAEMGSRQADMPQVAQVFLKRLSLGMPLGSDVTAYYGAGTIGAEHSVVVDTPYNTRIHAGLPPGPIGAPSLTALKAVAHPAAGDYVFFLSGDDGKTYFARTDAEHEANKVHCQQLCAIP